MAMEVVQSVAKEALTRSARVAINVAALDGVKLSLPPATGRPMTLEWHVELLRRLPEFVWQRHS